MEVLFFGVSFIRGSLYSIANIENIRILMYLQYVVTAAISLARHQRTYKQNNKGWSCI